MDVAGAQAVEDVGGGVECQFGDGNDDADDDYGDVPVAGGDRCSRSSVNILAH